MTDTLILLGLIVLFGVLTEISHRMQERIIAAQRRTIVRLAMQVFDLQVKAMKKDG